MKFSTITLSALSLGLLVQGTALAHDPPGELLADQSLSAYGATQCYVEERLNHNNQTGEHVVGPNFGGPIVPCPRFYSASVVDAKFSQTNANVSNAINRSQSNESKVRQLEDQLSEAIRKIEDLTSDLDVMKSQLRQTQSTVAAHRDNFNDHRHTTNGSESEPPHY